MKEIKQINVLAFQIIEKLCKKYNLSYEFSVSDNPLDISLLSDFYVNFTTICYCMEQGVTFKQFVKWYDANEKNKQHINIQSYCNGLRHAHLKKQLL